MEYLELNFVITGIADWQKDVFIQDLAEIGFDAFDETDIGFRAFIVKSQFNIASLDTLLQRFPDTVNIDYQIKNVPHENWNTTWESNFKPLSVAGKCYVRATFHASNPDYPIEIVIDPKMAFGTGHHQTTALMMEYLLEEEIANKKVLDMGCGTGILGILALKLGALKVFAVDHDPVCCESAEENAQLNRVSPLSVSCGDSHIIPEKDYDIIVANINRNILFDQLEDYAEKIKTGGLLFLSGFYEGEDLRLLKTKANDYGFEYMNHKMRDQWVAAKFKILK